MKASTTSLEGKAFTDALTATGEAMTPPVRKVRILETLSVIPTIIGKDGNAQKAYKGDANYCYYIYQNNKGNWTGHVISRFTANQKDFEPGAHTLPDGTSLIMRIRGNDMISIGEGEERRIMRVVKFSTGQIAMAEHFEAGALKARDTNKEDTFKYLTVSPSGLQKKKARLVHVNPAGKLFDPGFGE
jgi:CRISPR-associated endonuclease Csn1